ncbi:MAG: UMP kinase [Thermoprotei archaeon]|nr:MAG: UMP kinase [Thermoprotei archaeon]RLE71863.1 MAG: UMP kinase [Thermoprotei archaeon]
MRIVISLGGSLITRELTANNIKKYGDVLKRIKDMGHQLAVVCGGGKVAREYINVAKELGVNNTIADQIGILATFLNAYLIIAALGEYAYREPLKRVNDLEKYMYTDKILVFGGNEPGVSTDFDAAILAEYFNADLLINATNVDGVYEENPRKNPNARKFDELSYSKFEEIILKNKQAPGKYELFDISALKIIERSKIKLIVLNGIDPENILKAVVGEKIGTLIH